MPTTHAPSRVVLSQARERSVRCHTCAQPTWNINGRCDLHGGDGPGVEPHEYRKCSTACGQHAVVTLVLDHPALGAIFTDRCWEHRHDAAHPIVDHLRPGTEGPQA